MRSIRGLPIDPDVGSADATSRVGRRLEPSVLVAIALGGALGTLARYGVAQLAQATPGEYPWATFATNVTGSFALGLVLALLLRRLPPTRLLRAFLGTGLLGAYTTYSTFAVETDLLIRDGYAGTALTYAAASLLAGFAAAWAGIWAAVAVDGRRR